ncbi:MAG TPA: tyrosine-protein phosphatase [Myxococcota bacterium]|nr:tyrosine-protein phosphatase [Myxococcota bacterium]
MNAVSKKFFAGMCLACLSFACGGAVIAGQAAKDSEKRPVKWATSLEKPGLPNLFKVSDDLYRGAQPEDLGFAELVKLGVKTVVNLRALHSEREELDKTSMNYRHIKFSTFHPEEEDVVAFLKILADPAKRPVFVHCQHGSDRTGMMTAYYRIVFQGWTKEEAIREMTTGGYGFHSIWQNLVKFIRKSDIEKIRKASGIK